MQVTKKLNVSLDEFFDFVEKSIKYDIKNATGEDIDQVVQGYSYEKTLANALKQSGNVLTTIEKYERGSCYQSKVTSNQGFNYMTFDVAEIDDENVEVTYSEEFISHRKMNNLNYKFMLKLYKKRIDRRMNLLVENIELSIKQEKGSELCQD
ncbi:MAG: DUF3284 domain-containing protein [Clostridia bacterium]